MIKLRHLLESNVFYRGENDSGKRIDEPFKVAKKLNALFASEKISGAKMYGDKIIKITAQPTAKILRYDSPDFWGLLKRRMPPNKWIGSVVKPGETLVNIVDYLTALAYKAGYDAIVFGPSDDIGTMIFHRNVFKMEPEPLKENLEGNETLIVVDVQPEYQKWICFLPKLVNELNQRRGKTVFLYNGHDTLGMVTEDDYKMWWFEQGLEEEVMDGAAFYDKGYAFFRYCMDSGGLDNQTIANFVRFMYDNDIRDSRQMNREMWAKYLWQHRKTDRKEVFDLLHKSDDCVNIPDLMDYLKQFNNVILCGGGVSECLREVEISMLALGKHYDVETQYTY